MPTVFIHTDAGLNTYKSELVESNDTAIASRFQLGVYAGEEKVVGFVVRMEMLNVDFELNDSTLTLVSQDTFARYRWHFLYLGIAISNVAVGATSQGEDLADVSASGYGVNMGAMYPFQRTSLLSLDVTLISPADVQNLLGDEPVSMGLRTEIDLNARFNLTQNLIKLLVGYRMRQFSVTTTNTFAESDASTYFGLGFDMFF